MTVPTSRHLPLRGTIAVLAVAAAALLAPRVVAQNGPAEKFPGMVEIPAGEFEMGYDLKKLEKQFQVGRRNEPPFLKGDDKDFWWWFLKSEGPAHDVETEAYYIDLYTVTNAQYRRFLEQTAKSTEFIGGKELKIFDVAIKVFGESPAEKQMRFIYWLNAEKLDSIKARIMADNAGIVETAIKDFNANLPPAAHVAEFDKLPERERVSAWIRFKLPEQTALVVYRRPLPSHWEQGRIPEGEEDCPVRWVTALDADAFAEWAGKHVPTEAEWEKAARGPKNFIYPWGNEWKWADKNRKVADTERNRVVWQKADARDGRPKGPHFPMKDRPVAVDALPESASPYGLHHMLGNTLEWTSSIPKLYEKSEAEDWPFLGKQGYRVLRSQAYGGGLAFRDMELKIRNTARVMATSVRSGIPETMMFGGVSFRCAKYAQPTRDVMSHRLAHLRKIGRLRDDPKLVLDPDLSYGVELPSYAPPGQEGKGKVFVTEGTRIVGVVRLPQLPFGSDNELQRAAEDGPVLLAYLQWNGNLELEVLKLVEEVYKAPPPDPNAEKQDDEKEEPDPNRPKDGDTIEVERATFVPYDPDAAYFLAAVKQEDLIRIAVVVMSLKGPEIFGFLPRKTEDPYDYRIQKVGQIVSRPEARIDPKTGLVRIRLAIPTRSMSSKDVFGLPLVLKVRARTGSLEGDWLQVIPK